MRLAAGALGAASAGGGEGLKIKYPGRGKGGEGGECEGAGSETGPSKGGRMFIEENLGSAARGIMRKSGGGEERRKSGGGGEREGDGTGAAP